MGPTTGLAVNGEVDSLSIDAGNTTWYEGSLGIDSIQSKSISWRATVACSRRNARKGVGDGMASYHRLRNVLSPLVRVFIDGVQLH
jgi:hypothetical protein